MKVRLDSMEIGTIILALEEHKRLMEEHWRICIERGYKDREIFNKQFADEAQILLDKIKKIRR